MTIDAETLRTICWSFVACFAISGGTIYSIVRLLATGRAIFEKRSEDDADGRVIRMGR